MWSALDAGLLFWLVASRGGMGRTVEFLRGVEVGEVILVVM